MSWPVRLFVYPFSILILSAPYGFREFCAQILAIFFYDILRFRKKIMFDNLEIAYPGLDIATKEKWSRYSIYRLGLDIVEFVMLPALDKSWFIENVEMRGMHNYQEAAKKGKGVLLLSLHLGNVDMAISAIAANDIPISVISKRFKSKWLDNFWYGLRGLTGARFIDAHSRSNAFEILKNLRDQRSVVFVLDQFMGKPFGVRTKFFGRDTSTAYGLALFAKKTKAPVITVYTYRDLSGKIIVEFGPEIELLAIDEYDSYIRDQTQLYNDVLEQIVRRFPEQWMWIHRRWKRTE